MTISEINKKANDMHLFATFKCPYNCGSSGAYHIQNQDYDYKNFEEFLDGSAICLSCLIISKIHCFWSNPNILLDHIKFWFGEDEIVEVRDVDEHLKKQQTDIFDSIFN